MASPITPLFKARFPDASDVVLVNDFRYRKGRQSKKTGRRGKRRMTVEFKSEVVACDYSAHNLMRGPAEQLQKMIRSDFGKITKKASPATIEKRKQAAKAFAAGKTWARKAYRGGTKAKAERAPDPNSTTWGVDSGHLRDSFRPQWVASQSAWILNVAGNRLNPEPFRNHAAFVAFLTELKRQVPALDPAKLGERRGWLDALDDATRDAIINLSDRRADLRSRRLKTQIGIVRNVLSVVA